MKTWTPINANYHEFNSREFAQFASLRREAAWESEAERRLTAEYAKHAEPMKTWTRINANYHEFNSGNQDPKHPSRGDIAGVQHEPPAVYGHNSFEDVWDWCETNFGDWRGTA